MLNSEALKMSLPNASIEKNDNQKNKDGTKESTTKVVDSQKVDMLKPKESQLKRNASPRSTTDDSPIPTKKAKKERDVPPKPNISNVDTASSLLQLAGSLERRKRSSDTSVFSMSSSKRLKSGNAISDVIGEKNQKKHNRKRMKSLLQAVLDQMEFYFGDSNLSKDRFLRKLIDSSPDGYVDMSIFGNFNKLQSLDKDGVSLRVMALALKKSKMLQLNKEETKVRRITPVKEISPEETNSRTIYVEQLPNHATHMWIQTVFSQCGKVVYVSLPTYKTTKQIKGFAFVEFENAEEAARACAMLNNPLPAKAEEKPGKFPKGNKTLKRLQKIIPPKAEQDSNEENISDDQKGDGMSTLSGAVSKKKKKKKAKKKKLHESATEEAANVKPSNSQTDQAEGKKKKKKKKKRLSQTQEGNVNPEGKSTVTVDSLKSKRDESKGDNVELKEDKAEGSMSEDQSASQGEEEKTTEKEGGKERTERTEEEETERGKRRKKKKKKKGEKGQQQDIKPYVDTAEDLNEENKTQADEKVKGKNDASKGEKYDTESKAKVAPENSSGMLSRRERKRLRQEDIRRKKMEREKLAAESGEMEEKVVAAEIDVKVTNSEENKQAGIQCEVKSVIQGQGQPEDQTVLISEAADSETDDSLRSGGKGDGLELTSILKSKKGAPKKKVGFDPVPTTKEFIKGKEIRKRKKAKRDDLHLRVISKKDWLSLKAEYISQQKSHMAALKESLRELRQQENHGRGDKPGHVDLEDVFGTKRLKPSQDVKMAHVESLKFTPNVIVQWKCSHEMHRDKIRTMFREISGDSIAYIDAKEEAKTGYIRFKDETSAEEFSKMSRHSTSFMARVLPADQQQAYWDKANADRINKLGRKKQEKGSERIARKVFERNKATFHQKSTHTVFNDDDDDKDDQTGTSGSSKQNSAEEKKDEGVGTAKEASKS